MGILAIGFASGILTGLMGIGGGILLVPAMIWLLGFRQHTAHGTSLAVILPKAIIGAAAYAAAGRINYPIAAELAVGGVIGATIGAKIANSVSSVRLRRMFALLLIVVSARMFYDAISNLCSIGGAQAAETVSASILPVVGVGLIAGGLSGLLGVGGGVVMVPAMIYLLHIDQKIAQGISLLVIIPVAISGVLVHARKGNVDLRSGKWLALGGIGGSYFGAFIAGLCCETTLRIAFGALLLFIGWTTFRRRHPQEAIEIDS